MDQYESDPLQHFESWNLQALSPTARNEIRSGLLNAYGEVAIGAGIPSPAKKFSEENTERVYRYVQLAFDAIAGGFFKSGVLTKELMSVGIPAMVSDALIASGLTRGPSGLLGQHPGGDLSFGYYQVPGSHITALKGLIHPLACKWRARLLDAQSKLPDTKSTAEVPESKSGQRNAGRHVQPGRKRGRKRDVETIGAIRSIVATFGPLSEWKDHLEELAQKLKDAEIDPPERRKNDGSGRYKDWVECLDDSRDNFRRIIESRHKDPITPLPESPMTTAG